MSAGGIVIWFTGLPASGKTTLAMRVQQALAATGKTAVLLDSDALRPLLAVGLEYGAEDRAAFYRRLGQLAAELARQHLAVLVAATAPLRSHREAARSRAPAFAEVFVDVPREECEARDPKGLYALARAGGAPHLPGAGATYEPPDQPDVIASGGHDDGAIDAIVRLVPT